jgi:hypothetical protein
VNNAPLPSDFMFTSQEFTLAMSVEVHLENIPIMYITMQRYANLKQPPNQCHHANEHQWCFHRNLSFNSIHGHPN